MGVKTIFKLDNWSRILRIRHPRKEVALVSALILLGGIFGLAYAATSAVTTISPAGSAPDIAVVHSCEESGYENYGPYDSYPSFPENVIGGTGGELSSGNKFFIQPRPAFSQGLWIQVEMVNRKEINKKYTSFTENFAVYQFGGDNAENVEQLKNNANWNKLTVRTENSYLTLVGGPATFQIPADNCGYDKPLVVVLESGDFYAKENYSSYPGVVNYLSIEEAEY